MAGRVDTDVWANEAVVADGDKCFVEYSEVEVGKEPLAHTNLFAVVTVERLDDQDLIISLAFCFSDGRSKL